MIKREQATMEGIHGEGESLGCIEKRATLRSLKAKVSTSDVGPSTVRRELLTPHVGHCLLLISVERNVKGEMTWGLIWGLSPTQPCSACARQASYFAPLTHDSLTSSMSTVASAIRSCRDCME